MSFFFVEISFIENDFYMDLKHCLDTKRMNMIDYTNYIQNEDEQILINYIKQVNHIDYFIFSHLIISFRVQIH
jgi:hypothetical protein